MRKLLKVGVTVAICEVDDTSVIGEGRFVTGSIEVAKNRILCRARNSDIGRAMAPADTKA